MCTPLMSSMSNACIEIIEFNANYLCDYKLRYVKYHVLWVFGMLKLFINVSFTLAYPVLFLSG